MMSSYIKSITTKSGRPALLATGMFMMTKTPPWMVSTLNVCFFTNHSSDARDFFTEAQNAGRHPVAYFNGEYVVGEVAVGNVAYTQDFVEVSRRIKSLV